MYDALLDARNRMAFATSMGCPVRLIRACLINAAFSSLVIPHVSIGPGETALTRMGASSRANPRVSGVLRFSSRCTRYLQDGSP
jgi:hypothetical protein